MSFVRLPVTLVAITLLLTGCGEDRTEPDRADEPAATTLLPDHPSTSATTPPTMPAQAGVQDGPRVVGLDVDAEVPCSGAEASVALSYRTEDATAVAFVVDQQPIDRADPPPLSGDETVAVPCDGNVHTLVVVAASPEGQTLATRAVRTVPAG
jgi:hypothetical protein